MTDGSGRDGPPVETRPRPDLDVPPSPVRGPRGGRRAGIAVLVAVGAVIAAAVGVAQLAPAEPPVPRTAAPVPSVAAPSAAAVAPSDAGPTPDASSILAATPPRLSRDDLRSAVRDGSLEGRLVFVDGVIVATPIPCTRPRQDAGGCVDLAVPGIGVPIAQADTAIPWTREPPGGAWLVTVARDGELVYLGSLVPWERGPRSLAGIQTWRDAAGSVFRAGSLLEAEGWLVIDPVHPCPARDPAATPCPAPPPFLATDEPLPDGVLVSDAGQAVDLAAPVPGLEPGAVVTGGTFLVATVPGTDRDWRVIARYVPSRSVRVLVP